MNDTTGKDRLFASPIGQIAGFTFDEQVAAVFPDMLNRSIPGYQSIIAQSGLLAARFAKSGTHCYDLGCSLGQTTLAMHNNLGDTKHKLVAVDNSPAMINAFAATLDASGQRTGIELRCEDLAETNICNASVVAMNFTLQFVAPENRLSILKKICHGMIEGGVLILSEKVVFTDPEVNLLHIEMYHEFKRANGYSDLEVSQKRTALENVLVPDTVEQHQERLKEAGFREVSVWFQCFNFMSLIALR